MIRHQFIGSICEQKFDLIIDSTEVDDRHKCIRCDSPECFGELDFNWGKMNYLAGEQSVRVDYYQNNQTGEIVIAGPYTKPRVGFEKKSVYGAHAIGRLEKELNNYAISSTVEAREAMHWQHETMGRQIAADFRALTPNAIEREAGELYEEQLANPDPNFVPQTKFKIEDPSHRAELAKEVGMAQINNQPHKAFTAHDPGITIEL